MAVNIILHEKYRKKPIVGVNIHIFDRDNNHWTKTTDMRGRAVFDMIQDGTYIIAIKDSEYRPYYEKTYLDDDSIVYLKLEKAYA